MRRISRPSDPAGVPQRRLPCSARASARRSCKSETAARPMRRTDRTETRAMTGASHGTQPDSMHVQCTRLHPKQDVAGLHALGSMTNLDVHPHASACMHVTLTAGCANHACWRSEVEVLSNGSGGSGSSSESEDEIQNSSGDEGHGNNKKRRNAAAHGSNDSTSDDSAGDGGCSDDDDDDDFMDGSGKGAGRAVKGVAKKQPVASKKVPAGKAKGLGGAKAGKKQAPAQLDGGARPRRQAQRPAVLEEAGEEGEESGKEQGSGVSVVSISDSQGGSENDGSSGDEDDSRDGDYGGSKRRAGQAKRKAAGGAKGAATRGAKRGGRKGRVVDSSESESESESVEEEEEEEEEVEVVKAGRGKGDGEKAAGGKEKAEAGGSKRSFEPSASLKGVIDKIIRREKDDSDDSFIVKLQGKQAQGDSTSPWQQERLKRPTLSQAHRQM